MRGRSLAIVVAAMTCVVIVTGCGSNGQPTAATGPASAPVSSPSGRFNDTDVAFAQGMIVHHQQAVLMARMAADHTQDPKVRQLAATIEAEQMPEIQAMTGWLQDWGRPVPTGTPGMMTSPIPGMSCPSMPGMMSHMPGMMGSPATGMSCPSMPGMMSQEEMSQMMAAHGADFDRMFLQMMLRHHEGAIKMARAEQARGANPTAEELARSIETSQTAQIAQMRQMLATSATPTP